MYNYIMSFTTDPDYNETPEEDTYDSSLYEIDSWDELDIPPDLLRGIYAHGFEKPSPIQRKAIKPIILNKDIMAQAQSGTGKTATFTIGALSNINTKNKDVQVMVLSPTRELSIQTANVFNAVGSMMEGLVVQILIGGNSIDEDIQNLKNKPPQVVVGCPGRVYDMIRRNTFNARKVKLVILDEADEMFSSGFKEQVYNIFQSLHKDIQVALFSATIPSYIYPITQKLMRDPVRISVKAEQLTLDGITQYFVAVEDDKQKLWNVC